MGWKNKLRRIFPRQDAIYLVVDQECIFIDSSMIKKLQDQGISFIDYNDPVDFRYLYERKYRHKLVGTLIIRVNEFLQVPFDIFSQSFQIRISLSDFLEHLDVSAAKDSGVTIKELIEIDDVQLQSLSYEETIRILHQNLLVEDDSNYPLIEGFDFTSFGDAAMKIGKWRSEEVILEGEYKYNADKINLLFQNWITEQFDQLMSLPPYPFPYVVHQIADVMNQSDYSKKKALIVMDGMSFTQWQIINNYLLNNGFNTEVHPVLAWIPSVTSVSRQAIFSGKVPGRFSNTISTTSYEKQQWQEYWMDQGYKKSDVFYQRALGNNDYAETDLKEKIESRKIIGCVIDNIDKFMHSAQQGLWSVQSELIYWLEKDFLRTVLNDLLNHQFEVFITSDHGNVESIGVGRINQGILANSKGERVRIYDDGSIRQRTARDYSTIAKIWNSNFLPKNFYPLIAQDDFAFIKKNDKIVSHGGTHIEEVFVPFVKVTK